MKPYELSEDQVLDLVGKDFCFVLNGTVDSKVTNQSVHKLCEKGILQYSHSQGDWKYYRLKDLNKWHG